MMATSRLLFLSVIALAIFRCRGDCPVLAVQFGDPSALNTTTLGVYLSSEDAAFQGTLSANVGFITRGEVSAVFTSVEQLTASGTISGIRGDLQPIPFHLQLEPLANQSLYYALSVWSLNEAVATGGCPSPDTGVITAENDSVVNMEFGCKSMGSAIMEACLTVGNEPFNFLNGTYRTYSIYFPLLCTGVSGTCELSSSIVPAEVCLQRNQTKELILSGAGNWDLFTGEFDGDIDIDSRRGYCIVNRQFGGVPNIASDVDINANFPIVEMFPDLGLYIEAFFEEEGLTSPVVYSIGTTIEDVTVLAAADFSIPSQGSLDAFEAFVDFDLFLPCAGPGITLVYMEFNISAFVNGTLQTGQYMPLFHRDCTPDSLSSSPSNTNQIAKIAAPIVAFLVLLALSGIIVIVLVVLTQRHKRKILDLTADIELQSEGFSNAYLKKLIRDPFEFLEEYSMEYNYPSLELVGELGEGCFGRVFKAKAPGLHRGDFYPGEFVAVKSLKGDDGSQLLDEFVKEVQTCIRFDHDNVIRLVGVCTKSFEKCMIFEYMDLGCLHDLLRCSNPDSPDYVRRNKDDALLTPDLFLHCTIQVAEGLTYLAELRFVHRDIAARNCLINGSFVIKIADFGMSREVNASDYYRIGSTKALLPIRWMPPEAIMYGKFTMKSDVWSFGVLMWEIYSFGQHPFGGQSNHEVIDRVKSGQMLECTSLCPPAIFDIMHHCWTRVPGKRPSISDVLSQLHQLARVARGGLVDPSSIPYVNLGYVLNSSASTGDKDVAELSLTHGEN